MSAQVKPTHPSYLEMIKEALANERKGLSTHAIKKFIADKYKDIDAEKMKVPLRMALKKGLSSEPASLKQTKGTGASGSYKLADPEKKPKEKKPKKPKKKPVATKPKKDTKAKKAKTSAKKTTASKPKKAGTKSPAAKKLAAKKSPKKPATKKPSAKKTTKKGSTPKKSGAKKAAKTTK